MYCWQENRERKYIINECHPNLIRAIQLHHEHDCYPRIYKSKHINGAVLKLTKDIFTQKEAEEYIYEIDDSVLNIYNRTKKIQSIECPVYGLRCLVVIDIMARCDNHSLSPLLLKVMDENTQEIEFELGDTVLDKIDSIFTCKEEMLQLEAKVMDLLDSFINGKQIDISDSLKSVFKIVSKHYLETLNA